MGRAKAGRWLLFLCFLSGFVALSCSLTDDHVRIAAGRQGSGVYRLGTALADVFSGLGGVRASVVEGKGNRNSLQRLLGGEAELAVAFSDSEGDGEVRTLVPLYELYLYIIVWEDAAIADVPALEGRKVGAGPSGSGTDSVARRLLGHYGFAEQGVTVVNDSHRTISQAFLKRELDAVFLLGSIESKAVSRMLGAPGTKLLSLDDPERVAPVMEGIVSKHPYVVSHIIPKHLFGAKPKSQTGVIGVHALLVARSDLSDVQARSLTRAVFAHKVQLGRQVRRLREISERFDPQLLRFPLHPGAAQYYRRDEPPAILEWADTISLFITVVLMAWSAVAAFAAGRRRKRKGFLDGFYHDFQAIIHRYDEEDETPPDQMDAEQLQDIRESLQSLRRKCFEALASGTVSADEAFVVFNDYLRFELQDIERIQRDRRVKAASDGEESTEGS